MTCPTHLLAEGLPVWIMGIKNIQRTNFLVMYCYFPAILLVNFFEVSPITVVALAVNN